MKQFAIALVLFCAASSVAQEIGTEISPSTPNSGVQSSPPPPPPSAEPKTTGKKSKGAKAESEWAGGKASSSSGDFGIRAGFGSSGSTALPEGRGAAAVAAPNVGFALFGGDSFKLLVDLGFGMVVVSEPVIALSATLGFDYMFRTPGDALRPFFHAGAFFTMAGSTNFAVGFGAQLGFGAEYFFSPAFSVNGRLLLAVPMAVPGNFVVGIFTVTPGVGATWYF